MNQLFKRFVIIALGLTGLMVSGPVAFAQYTVTQSLIIVPSGGGFVPAPVCDFGVPISLGLLLGNNSNVTGVPGGQNGIGLGWNIGFNPSDDAVSGFASLLCELDEAGRDVADEEVSLPVCQNGTSVQVNNITRCVVSTPHQLHHTTIHTKTDANGVRG